MVGVTGWWGSWRCPGYLFAARGGRTRPRKRSGRVCAKLCESGRPMLPTRFSS